jgi:hypothetical protein
MQEVPVGGGYVQEDDTDILQFGSGALTGYDAVEAA